MIQAKYKELPTITDISKNLLLQGEETLKLLFKNPTHEPHIIDDDQNDIMAKFINKLRAKISKKGQKTTEEEILTLLFRETQNEEFEEATLVQLQQAIRDYQGTEGTPSEDLSHYTLISYLETVGQQLKKESKQGTDTDSKKTLIQLATAVSNFVKAYKRKTKPQIQARQAKLEKILNKQEAKKHQNTKQVNFAKLKNNTKPIQQTESQQEPNTKEEQSTDKSDYKTAQKNEEQKLTATIIANLKSTTELLSKIINTLLS